MIFTGTWLYTNDGSYAVIAPPCSNGAKWTADNCFKYVNEDNDWAEHQADKLLWFAKKISDNREFFRLDDWYLDRNNYVDIFETEVK